MRIDLASLDEAFSRVLGIEVSDAMRDARFTGPRILSIAINKAFTYEEDYDYVTLNLLRHAQRNLDNGLPMFGEL